MVTPAANGIDARTAPRVRRRLPITAVTLYQAGVVVGFVLLLEVLCVTGVIDKITMPPPHRIAVDFLKLLVSKGLWPEIGKSMGNVLLAFASQ